MPIVEPVLAFLQSATLLSFHELVVAADHLVKSSWIGSTRRSLVTLESLRRSSAEYSGRGVRRARAALEFTRQGAESRMETLLRLLMAQFGLDVLELQVDIYHDGAWIGRLDMVDRDRKLIIEYDGEQHRTDRGQYLKDQRRLDRARAAGYSILRLHKEDVLVRPLQTVHVIADFLGLPLRPVDTQFARYFTER